VKPTLLEGVWIATSYIDGAYVPDDPARVDGGHINLPDGPGLGLDIDESRFGDPVASFT
jgi:L-alanine-DL-glutamate epimerase-like enolase superfamily enzyme